jgi:hypothetical protein
MAEILVSDLCDLSPAAAHRRVFRCRAERGPPLFLGRFRLFFSLFFIVSRPIAFFSQLQGLILYFRRLSPL